MGFWDSNSVSADNLARLGPFVNGIVGTEGKYSVLNDAVAAGWTRMILAPGASLNANLTLTTTMSIVAFAPYISIVGNYGIIVQGSDCYFEGFSIRNNAGIAFYVTGSRARFFRMSAVNCLSHGYHFNAAWGDHEMISCIAYANGGDGVRLESQNYSRISMLRSQSNVGWGLNDLTNAVALSCSQISGNTAGQVNGASTYIDHSVKTT